MAFDPVGNLLARMLDNRAAVVRGNDVGKLDRLSPSFDVTIVSLTGIQKPNIACAAMQVLVAAVTCPSASISWRMNVGG